MNLARPLTLTPLKLAWLGLFLTLGPAVGHAQQSRKPHDRPAARPTIAPSPAPAASPSVPATDASAKEAVPPAANPADTPPPQTEIDATDGATFASKDRIAVFSGSVRVKDTRFQLSCDKLTVFLNKNATTDAAAAATPSASATPAPLAAGGNPPAPADQGQGGGGIDHAIAEGHVIIMQKRAPTKPGEEEKISIGRGEKGTFDNKTGDMTLYGMPVIEQNGNSHSATSPETVMVIHKDSSLDTKGPNKTILLPHKGSAGLEMPGVPMSPGGGKPKKKGNNAPPSASPAASRAPGA